MLAIPTGASPYCSFWDKWHAGRAAQAQVDSMKKIKGNLRVLKKQDGLYLIDSIHGQWWIPETAGQFGYQFAEIDRDIYGKVSGGEIVLDCGANIGQYSKRVLEQGAAKVIAIEPAPENLECLRRNLASEIAQGRAIVYPKGVWDKEDVLPMIIDDDNSGTDSFVISNNNKKKQIQLPLTTIDKIVDELGLSNIDIIKMDIEGSERNALRGAERTLANFHPRLAIAVYHLPDDPEIIIGLTKKIVSSYKVDCDCIANMEGLFPEIANFVFQ